INNASTLQVTGTFTSGRNVNLGTSGGIITVTGTNSFTLAGVVSDVTANDPTASLTKMGSGELVLLGNNSYPGRTLITAGTLTVSSDANLGAVPASTTAGNVVLNGGALSANSTFTLDSKRGIAVGPTSAGAIDVISGKILTYGGVIADNG